MPCIDCFAVVVFHWESELTFLAAGLHLDQNPFHKPNLETIQGSTLFASEHNFFILFLSFSTVISEHSCQGKYFIFSVDFPLSLAAFAAKAWFL